MKRLTKYLRAVVWCLPFLLLLPPSASAGEAGTLRFPEDGKLKIAVFSDLQTTQNVPRNLLEDLCAVLDAEEPDLVVFLGDQVEGKHPWVHLGDNEANVKRIIDQILAPVTERNIPFAVVFGNHDAQDAGVDKETQMAYYRTFPGCLAEDEGDSLPGCGTYHLLYYTADGSRPALNLYFVDSLEYGPGGGYGCVTEEQAAWCRTVGESLSASNGGTPVPALVFQHIIVPEIYSVFTRVQDKNEDGAFAGKGIGQGSWYTAPAGMEGLEEAPCPPESSNGQFAAWREAGDVIAAFFGHDHVNSFTACLDGIRLTACPGATWTSYNSGSQRGVRIIEIDQDHIAGGRYETYAVRFKDLCPSGFPASIRRYFGSSHMWEMEIPALLAALALAGGVSGVLLTRRRQKRKQAFAAGKPTARRGGVK